MEDELPTHKEVHAYLVQKWPDCGWTVNGYAEGEYRFDSPQGFTLYVGLDPNERWITISSWEDLTLDVGVHRTGSGPTWQTSIDDGMIELFDGFEKYLEELKGAFDYAKGMMKIIANANFDGVENGTS